MMKHLQNYGDCNMEDITTEYIQNFIIYLEKQGLQRGTVRLYFQKLACVLNDAYKNELFDERILRRVKRPKREQSKKSFLTERELKRLFSTSMPEKYDNMKAISKNCFAGDLRNFLRKISTFFWLSIAGYAIEKEIERFRWKT